jgi:KUP system potassium uptake protein
MLRTNAHRRRENPTLKDATEIETPPDETRRGRLALLALTALGVAYGDIGTSPLYALRECFHGQHAIRVSELHVLGVLSLIFWSLIIVVSIKYLLFILRADNHGEGGIMALTALVTPVRAEATQTRKLMILLGLFGAALLYADGMITPAISVLSAVEGLEVAAPAMHPYIVPITVALLVGLFLFQARGTARVGSVFGPVMLLWMLAMAALGIGSVVQNPHVLLAVNPWYAGHFFFQAGWTAFVVLGTVFLVVTGGESLYADIGHFGTKPIRLAWFSLVLPSLLLNYFGQGALLLRDAEAAVNPFFRLAPQWALYPLIVLAASAAVIASQALITGAFSLTLQGIQLGYIPRLRIEHTSPAQRGQIYVPAVNWALLVASTAMVVGFESSGNLSAAYGVAIAVTMAITTALFFVFTRDRWKWPLALALGVCGGFLVLDFGYVVANMPKVDDGGWLPLVVAGVVFLLMSTWRDGRRHLGEEMRQRLIPLDLFVAELLGAPPRRVPGVAVFMSGNPIGTPPALRHNVAHNHVLHETTVIVCVETSESPRVPAAQRAEVEEIGEGFWRVVLTYGFMEEPHVPWALDNLRDERLDLHREDISYFLGRETLLATKRRGLWKWREKLFVWMSRNAQTATRYFHLPPDRIVEIGVQVEL